MSCREAFLKGLPAAAGGLPGLSGNEGRGQRRQDITFRLDAFGAQRVGRSRAFRQDGVFGQGDGAYAFIQRHRWSAARMALPPRMESWMFSALASRAMTATSLRSPPRKTLVAPATFQAADEGNLLSCSGR